MTCYNLCHFYSPLQLCLSRPHAAETGQSITAVPPKPYSPSLANTRLPIQATRRLDTALHDCHAGPRQTLPSQCLPVHSWTARTYHAIPVLCMTFPDCLSRPVHAVPQRAKHCQFPTIHDCQAPRIRAKPHSNLTFPSETANPSHSEHNLTIPVPRLPYHANTNLTRPKHTLTCLSSPLLPVPSRPRPYTESRSTTAAPLQNSPQLTSTIHYCRARTNVTMTIAATPGQYCPAYPELTYPLNANALLSYTAFCIAVRTSLSSSRLRYFAVNDCISRFALSNRFFLHCSFVSAVAMLT